MSDERPRPRYGEYADAPPTIDYPPPTIPDEPERPRYNTRDLIVTTALLLIGAWDVAYQWSIFSELGPSLAQAFTTMGLNDFSSFDVAATAGLWVNISRAVILVATIVVSLLLVSRGRRAFWVPLAGGVLAYAVVFGVLAYVMFGDPAFSEFAERSSTGG